MSATLEEVSLELQETNKELSSIEINTDLSSEYLSMAVNIFSNRLDQLVEFMRGERLDDLEQRREQNKVLQGPDTSKEKEEKEDKGLLGKGFENLTGGLIADAKALLAPILSVIGMVVKGGILALVVGGLYMLFKTIKDNPVFLETITSIKNIWENSIVPTFNDIRKSVMDFIESPAFDRIVEVMDTLRNVFQTLFLRQLDTLVDTLSSVFDGLADVISGILNFDLGEIYTGLNKITGSILSGIVSTIDNIITAVLEIFGVSFEGDVTLLTAITRGITNIFQSIKNGVISIFTGIKDFVSSQFGFTEGQAPSVTDIIAGLYTLPFDLVRSVASWVAGKLGFDQISDMLSELSFAEILRSAVDTIWGLFTSAKDFIIEKLTSFSITDMIGGVASAAGDFLSGLLRGVLPDPSIDYGLTDPRKYITMAIPDSVYEFAGLNPDTGEMIPGSESEGTTAGVESSSSPARVQAGNELQMEGEVRRDAELEMSQLGRVGGPGSNAVNVSTNVQNNSNTTTQTRPPASSQPDNMSDTMLTVGFAP